MRRVLVVGGAGYIGSIVCQHLLRAGCQVIVFDRFMYGDAALDNLHGHCSIVRGDTRDISQLHATMKRCDAVVYLAELVGDAICKEHPAEAFETNELAAISAVRLARRLQKRFIYFSSCSVYGAAEDPDALLDENSELLPQSEYGKYKIQVEREILSDASPEACIFRLGTVFGLSLRPRFDLVVNLFAAKAYFDKKIEVFGGWQWRPQVHVRDVAEFVLAAVESSGSVLRARVFNIVTDNSRIRDLGKEIAQLVSGTELDIQNKESDSRNYRVDGARALIHLNFAPRRSIEVGVRELQHAFEIKQLTDYHNPRYSNVAWYRGDGHG